MRRREIPLPVSDDTGRVLGTQHAIAAILSRNLDMVRKRVAIVACHVESRALMVDMAEAERVFQDLPRRKPRKRQPFDDRDMFPP